MEIRDLNHTPIMPGLPVENEVLYGNVGGNFQSFMDEASSADDFSETVVTPGFTFVPRNSAPKDLPNAFSAAKALPAYQKALQNESNPMTDWQKYKDDQLLSNPGGDGYYLTEKKVLADSKEQESFWKRIGKDLSDSFENLKKACKDLFWGSEIFYRDETGQIQEGKERGLLQSVVELFKDLGSALSFGAWRPDGEKEPEGFAERVGFFFAKMKETFFGDLLQGVGGSVIRIGEDLALAGWNLVEVIPDATIGNFEEGRKLTTTVFDNGQVAIDYLTDILPTGNAWLRVHSANFDDLNDAKAPVLYNIEMPEHYVEDVRWKYVRNTPFRKTIETIGSLLADVAAIQWIGDTGGFSHGKKE